MRDQKTWDDVVSGKRVLRKAPKGDVHFDEWLFPKKGTVLDTITHAIADDIETQRKARGGRAVRSTDRRAFLSTIGAIVCNLSRAVYNSPNGSVAIGLQKPRTKRVARYDCAHVPIETRRSVVENAQKSDWLHKNRGYSGTKSTIVALPRLKALLPSRDDVEACIGRHKDQELIILSRRTKKGQPVDEEGRIAVEEVKHLIPYKDNAWTRAVRKELRALNDYLAAANITFIPDGEDHVDTHSRRMTRRFSLFAGQAPRFDQGGRLYGAFWETLKKERRRKSLRINGEEVTEVDFNALFTRLAYAECGKALGDGDPYDLGPDLAPYRGGVKGAINALFFHDSMFTKWPSDEIREGLPKGMGVKPLLARVLTKLPDLEPFFGKRMGFRFMFTESTILLLAMREVMARGMVALPLHDAVLVGRSQAEDTRRILEAAAKDITGQRIPASIK